MSRRNKSFAAVKKKIFLAGETASWYKLELKIVPSLIVNPTPRDEKHSASIVALCQGKRAMHNANTKSVGLTLAPILIAVVLLVCQRNAHQFAEPRRALVPQR